VSIRILLVDDHQMLLDGLRSILESEESVEIVGEARDGSAAIEMVQTLVPDLIIMDIGMRGMNGMEATRQIKAANPSVKIVALSTYSEKRYVLSMLEAGASGYVLKTSASDEMRRAVRAVAAGGHYLSSDIAGLVIDAHLHPGVKGSDAVYSVLGAREREVLQLLAEGHKSSEIARRLHLAPSTVETHRRNIMRKLDLHSIVELTKYAIREGLTSLDR
jgi:DNA-binding NarL/FixJ family response regulator